VGALTPRKRRRRLTPIPKAKRRDVTRGEYNGLIETLNERGRIIDEIHHSLQTINKNLDLQFRRMAQMQAELDGIRAAWTRSRRKIPA
jgi:hypothetical protein